MDRADVDPTMLARSLRFIRRINAVLGYTRATLWHLERMSRSWSAGTTIQLVDFATGSADIPRAILRWAERRGHAVRIIGIDRHPITVRLAHEQFRDARLQIVQADVLDLPFDNGSFDYAITSMFLHHLDSHQAVEVLRSMDRVARRGIIVADLLRHRRAYVWITLLTALCGPMVRHDARASVAQAFTKTEVMELRRLAGVEYAKYYRHFAHRFVLAGEKSR